MKLPPASALSGAVVGMALAVLLLPLALATASHPDLRRLASIEQASHEVPADGLRTSSPSLPKVDELNCFGCHNIERYHTGQTLPHDRHSRAGHCHVCHAFSGHTSASVREEACEECH